MWDKYQQLHADSIDLSVQAHGAGILNINLYWGGTSQSRINFYQLFQIINPAFSDPECHDAWQKHKHLETQKYVFLLSFGKISFMHSRIYPAVPANEAEHSQWLRKACTDLQLHLA